MVSGTQDYRHFTGRGRGASEGTVTGGRRKPGVGPGSDIQGRGAARWGRGSVSPSQSRPGHRPRGGKFGGPGVQVTLRCPFSRRSEGQSGGHWGGRLMGGLRAGTMPRHGRVAGNPRVPTGFTGLRDEANVKFAGRQRSPSVSRVTAGGRAHSLPQTDSTARP